MIKLAFCTDGIFPEAVGGMQRHSRLLIEELSKFDIDITVFHPHDKELFSKYSDINEILIEPIDKDKTYLKECYKYSERIYKHLEKMPEHIIYSQGLSVWYKIKKLKNIIINPHGLEPYQAISKKDKLYGIPFKVIFNKIFNNSDYVVSLGGGLTKILQKNIKNKNTRIITLPNGTNIPNFKRQNAAFGTVKVFFVGRFESNKGIDLLLQVAQDLNKEGYNKIKYILAGKGPLYTELKEKYKAKNISFEGFISDEQLINFYKEADVFVLPTLFEGMPTVVLEAMSYGLPIIVSDVGATAELVNSENGFLIEKNNPEVLKKSLINFINLQTEEKLKMQKASFLKLKNNFTWDKIAEKHFNLFTEIKNDGN